MAFEVLSKDMCAKRPPPPGDSNPEPVCRIRVRENVKKPNMQLEFSYKAYSSCDCRLLKYTICLQTKGGVLVSIECACEMLPFFMLVSTICSAASTLLLKSSSIYYKHFYFCKISLLFIIFNTSIFLSGSSLIKSFT